MVKKMMLLPLVLILIAALFSCEMTGNSSQVVSEAEPQEIYVEDFSTELSPEDFMAGEYSSDRSISGIGDARASSEISAYIKRWFDEYQGTWYDAVGSAYYYIDMVGQGPKVVPHVSTSEAMGYALRLLNYKYSLDNDMGYFEGRHWNTFRTIARFTKEEVNSADGLTYGACNWFIPTNYDPDTAFNTENMSGPATDGDMDIAYGLILASSAYRQYVEDNPSMHWRGKKFYLGRAGVYEEAALEYIRGIALHYYGTAIVNGQERNYLNIAPHDWEDAAGLTRPSDWMAHHLATFYDFYNKYGPATNKSFYANRIHDLLLGTLAMIEDNNWGNGFFPDFVLFDHYEVDTPWASPKMVGSGSGSYRALTLSRTTYGANGISDYDLWDQLGEEIIPNHLHWNACRAPWRFSEWTLFHGGYHHAAVRSVIERMRRYGFKPFSGVQDMGCGYDSNWNITEQPKPGLDYDAAFAGPGALTMRAFRVTNYSAYQYYSRVMRRNYEDLITQFQGPANEGYYSDSINAFSLLLMTDLMARPEF